MYNTATMPTPMSYSVPVQYTVPQPYLQQPYDITQNYGSGGLASFARIAAPIALGWALGPAGFGLGQAMGLGTGFASMIPAMIGGGLLSYGLAGSDRSFTDFLKGGLSAYGGASLGASGMEAAGSTLEGAAAPASTFASLPTEAAAGGVNPLDIPNVNVTQDLMSAPGGVDQAYIDKLPPLAPPVGGQGNVFDNMGQSLSGLGKLTQSPAGLKELVSSAAPAMAGMALESPADRGPVPTMGDTGGTFGGSSLTEEQRQAIAARYAGSTAFTPPNVGRASPYGAPTSYRAAQGGNVPPLRSGSFVIPSDVVSDVGDGSSNTGHKVLGRIFSSNPATYARGGAASGPIRGPGGGLDDLIQTNIDGVKSARLSNDEFVVPSAVVSQLGGGSNKAGSEKLYNFIKNVRFSKHNTTRQPASIRNGGLNALLANGRR